jgi:hypothetical protein
VDRRAEERAASHETGHGFERFAEEEGSASRALDGGERDGGREPTTTSGPVSTPSTSYASVSSVSATIANSPGCERPHRARR